MRDCEQGRRRAPGHLFHSEAPWYPHGQKTQLCREGKDTLQFTGRPGGTNTHGPKQGNLTFQAFPQLELQVSFLTVLEASSETHSPRLK